MQNVDAELPIVELIAIQGTAEGEFPVPVHRVAQVCFGIGKAMVTEQKIKQLQQPLLYGIRLGLEQFLNHWNIGKTTFLMAVYHKMQNGEMIYCKRNMIYG